MQQFPPIKLSSEQRSSLKNELNELLTILNSAKQTFAALGDAAADLFTGGLPQKCNELIDSISKLINEAPFPETLFPFECQQLLSRIDKASWGQFDEFENVLTQINLIEAIIRAGEEASGNTYHSVLESLSSNANTEIKRKRDKEEIEYDQLTNEDLSEDDDDEDDEEDEEEEEGSEKKKGGENVLISTLYKQFKYILENRFDLFKQTYSYLLKLDDAVAKGFLASDDVLFRDIKENFDHPLVQKTAQEINDYLAKHNRVEINKETQKKIKELTVRYKNKPTPSSAVPVDLLQLDVLNHFALTNTESISQLTSTDTNSNSNANSNISKQAQTNILTAIEKLQAILKENNSIIEFFPQFPDAIQNIKTALYMNNTPSKKDLDVISDTSLCTDSSDPIATYCNEIITNAQLFDFEADVHPAKKLKTESAPTQNQNSEEPQDNEKKPDFGI